MRNVVFIHGMFMTPKCWDGWMRHFAARGISSQAPAWPHHDEEPAAMRQKHPDPALGQLTLDQVVARYAELLSPMAEKPFLVGHSMGGLIVQLLLQKQLGAAGVAIDSAPPKGVISAKWSFLKSNWPVIKPWANGPFLPSLEEWHYAFANTLSVEEARAAYEQLVVPESRLVGRAPTTPSARIDFSAPHPPLLFVSGGADHIIPASLNRSNFGRYKEGAELHEFAGRCHYTLAQAGWEEVANYVADWLAKI